MTTEEEFNRYKVDTTRVISLLQDEIKELEEKVNEIPPLRYKVDQLESKLNKLLNILEDTTSQISTEIYHIKD